jgi:hypothetical protein
MIEPIQQRTVLESLAEMEVEILPIDRGASRKTIVRAGEYVVVPNGCWHRLWESCS